MLITTGAERVRMKFQLLVGRKMRESNESNENF